MYNLLTILILTLFTMGTVVGIIIIICAGAMAIAWLYVQFKNYIIPETKALLKAIRKRLREVKNK